jgi:hypothetical protein
MSGAKSGKLEPHGIAEVLSVNIGAPNLAATTEGVHAGGPSAGRWYKVAVL